MPPCWGSFPLMRSWTRSTPDRLLFFRVFQRPARRPIVLKRRQMIASMQQAERLEVRVKQIAILIAICLIPVPLRPQEHSPTTRTSGNREASGDVTLGERLAREYEKQARLGSNPELDGL